MVQALQADSMYLRYLSEIFGFGVWPGLNFVVDAGEALLQILPVDLLVVLHLLSMLLQFFLVNCGMDQSNV